MTRVYKVVLTGGPCGGKTSSLERIKSQFQNEIKVICIQELATVTIESGMNIVPENFNEETHKELTKAMIKHQIDNEDYFETMAKIINKDVLIICDRGTCDNFAYCSEDNKKTILAETKWSMSFLSYT
jgi:tRNA uridine 5-carbamoylmethylation protein Kti12